MRLIDADKLIERINGTGYVEQIKSNFLFIANMLPTVDAVEVVRSKWVEAEDIGDCCYACLNCGFIRDGYLSYPANYCPNCGAKMEEEQ